MREEPIAAVRARIDAARSLFVLTGAGMSAESGIPTFRDALTGLWSRFDPAQLASEEGFRADPALVWDWYAERRDGVRAAQPNAGHVALGDFARRRPGVLTLVSQNVDDLHQRAGNTDTIRLHGDITADRWLERARASLRASRASAQPGRRRAARACGNLLRPGVVWFGEMLPPAALEAAERAAEALRRGVDRRHLGRGVAGGGAGCDARGAPVPSWSSSIRTTAKSTTRPTWCCAPPRRKRCRSCFSRS